jgi:hypothetical protein
VIMNWLSPIVTAGIAGDNILDIVECYRSDRL